VINGYMIGDQYVITCVNVCFFPHGSQFSAWMISDALVTQCIVWLVLNRYVIGDIWFCGW